MITSLKQDRVRIRTNRKVNISEALPTIVNVLRKNHVVVAFTTKMLC